MKRFVCLLLALSLLLVVGCKEQGDPEATTEAPKGTEMVTLGDEDIEIMTPDGESTAPTEERHLLEIVDKGKISGPFLEDGSDEIVENVVCALIRNTGHGYLDYGEVTAAFGDQRYTFVVTGLPGGDAVWVMEKDRKTVEGDLYFGFLEEKVSQLRDVRSEDDRISVELLDGKAVVTNVSDKPLASVQIYYKQVHSDGNFLGGITYTCSVEAPEPGASVEITAGHSRARGCAVVRVDVTE